MRVGGRRQLSGDDEAEQDQRYKAHSEHGSCRLNGYRSFQSDWQQSETYRQPLMGDEDSQTVPPTLKPGHSRMSRA